MTPFPCSDPGPRCRLLWPISSQHLLSITCTLLFLSTATHETEQPRSDVALRLQQNEGPASSSRPQTLHVGMDQHQINVPASPVTSNSFHLPLPFPGPHPMVVITMIRMTLKTPSSRFQGRGWGWAQAASHSLTSPRSHLLECGIGPGLKRWLGAGGARGAETQGPPR